MFYTKSFGHRIGWIGISLRAGFHSTKKIPRSCASWSPTALSSWQSSCLREMLAWELLKTRGLSGPGRLQSMGEHPEFQPWHSVCSLPGRGEAGRRWEAVSLFPQVSMSCAQGWPRAKLEEATPSPVLSCSLSSLRYPSSDALCPHETLVVPGHSVLFIP